MGAKANLRVSAGLEDLIVAVQKAVAVATADELSKFDALRLAVVAREIRDKIDNEKKGGA